jgi:hypothetical protein
VDTHIDYLRLASWEFNAYVKIMPYLMDAWPKDWVQGKWLQYSGWRKEGLFVGRGMQGNKAHAILNLSGYLSQEWYQEFKRLDGWYCTRIDLQRTIKTPLSNEESLSLIRDDCDTKTTTLIESEENDTLYLGSRTADKFTRLYEKILDETYLRLEFELKGFRSRSTWEAIRKGEETDKIFMFYLERSKLPERIRFEYAQKGDMATDKVMRLQLVQEEEKRLDWIISLDKAMMKNMASHGIGEQVKIIVRAWGKFADYLDKKEVPD